MHLSSKTGNSVFVRLLASETLNTTASSILAISAPLVAISVLEANAFDVGLVTSASTAAPLVFGLSAGTVADRFDRRRTLVWCSLVRLCLVALVAMLFAIEWMSIPLLAVFGFALSAVKLLFDTVTITVIPTVVPRKDLSRANSWYEASNSVAYTGGPAIAGWLLQVLPAAAVYSVNAVLYLLSTCFLKGMALANPPRAGRTRQSHLADMAEGIRLLWAYKVQRVIALAAGTFNLFHTAFFTVFAYYAVTQLGFSNAAYGTIVSCVGLSGLLSAIFAPKLLAMLGPRAALIGSLLLIGPFGIPILFADGAPFVYRAVLIIGCLATWDFLIVLHLIMEQTIRQATVPEGELGRISAVTRFVSWGADPIGALLGGFCAMTAFGIWATLLICLAGLFVSGVILLCSKDIRALSVSH